MARCWTLSPSTLLPTLQQLQSQASAIEQLSHRRDKLKRKHSQLKSELAAAVSSRNELARELDAAVRARAVADTVERT
jgi:cell division protein FtsB